MSESPTTPVRYRTPDEMLARQQEHAARTVPPTPPPQPRLVEIVTDIGYVKRLEEAAQALYPNQPPDLRFLRLALRESGMWAPDVEGVAEFVEALESRGGALRPTYRAEPLPGSIYAIADENRDLVGAGLVAKLPTEKGRVKFYRAATTERVVLVKTVELWLLHPAHCAPCAARKR